MNKSVDASFFGVEGGNKGCCCPGLFLSIWGEGGFTLLCWGEWDGDDLAIPPTFSVVNFFLRSGGLRGGL
jgi:hypothetical protein